MSGLELKFDQKKLDQTILMLADVPRKIPGASSRALRRALSAAKTEAVSAISEDYAYKKGLIRAAFRTRFSGNTLFASLSASGTHIPLTKFKYTPKISRRGKKRQRKPSKVQIKRSGGLKIASQGAFTAQMRSSHIGIFIRTGQPRAGGARVGKSGTKHNEGIEQKYTISVAEMFGSKNVMKRTEKKAIETFEKRLEHEIRRAAKLI